MDFKELLQIAKQKVNFTCHTEYCSSGLVASAILCENGKVYTGINIDCDCGIGFCAEHSAISKMLEDGCTRVLKVVACSAEKVFPPCGRCREFLRMINFDNLQAEVLVEEGKAVTLRELLPFGFDKN